MTKFFTNLFLKSAGVNFDILEKCPGDRTKLVCIGATVVLTGIFATISGSFALYSVFYGDRIENFLWPVLLSIGMGLVWGFMIYNLDRYIVLSMRKKDSLGAELKIAVPRLLLAGIIALIISRPLEIRIFQDRLYAQIASNRNTELLKLGKDSWSNPELKIIGSEMRKLENQESDLMEELANNCQSERCQKLVNDIEAKESRLNNLYPNYNRVKSEIKEIVNNIDNKIGMLVNEEFGLNAKGTSLYENKKAELNSYGSRISVTRNSLQQLQKEYNDIVQSMNSSTLEKLKIVREDLSELRDRKKSLEEEIKESQKRADVEIEKAFSYNLIALDEALGILKSYKKDVLDEDGKIVQKVNNSMFWMGRAIFILFLLIETAPVLVKLLSPKGQYDVALEANDSYVESKLIYESNSRIEHYQNANEFQQQAFLETQSIKLELLEKVFDKWKSQIDTSLNGLDNREQISQLIEEIKNFQTPKYN